MSFRPKMAVVTTMVQCLESLRDRKARASKPEGAMKPHIVWPWQPASKRFLSPIDGLPAKSVERSRVSDEDNDLLSSIRRTSSSGRFAGSRCEKIGSDGGCGCDDSSIGDACSCGGKDLSSGGRAAACTGGGDE